MKFVKNIGNFFLKLLLITSLFAMPIVQAVDLNEPITPDEQAQFDQILVPVLKVYKFVKYSASVVAVIALLFAGISYMFSGNDMRKRDTSKNIAAYVLIGLTIIWAAPVVVDVMIA